ncbi:LysR family transcriptional regulator [Nguyenibacter vanlangensis]|uniref:LysR family transcriptional regulator n=1 Tax=Nguyenibacter vanlangensis TaxID=1216886 RepID=A0A7Y7IV18_9PROT|nr:LysR family transcriptional regulator [Nguyenibacter vanlangensis]NVN10320.1 LysR family transcriptional regulator [Nguyenibacter vanlangensis]
MQLRAIQSVAHHRGFRAAAIELGMSRSSLSHLVAAVERELGVRLFHRTTRSVAPTDIGHHLLADVRGPLAELLRAMERATSQSVAPGGVLRINMSSGAARQIMQSVMIDYARLHPEVTVDLVTENKLVDIVAAGFDAAVRLAEFVPADMIAIPFGPHQRFAVVGAPAYFADHPAPCTPADLAHHRCIRIRTPGGILYDWEFERRGERVAIDCAGPLILDEPLLMLQAARAGLGLAYLSEWNVADDLSDGRLMRVLDDWTPSFPGLCLYYSGRRYVPPPLRALIDLIKSPRAD